MAALHDYILGIYLIGSPENVSWVGLHSTPLYTDETIVLGLATVEPNLKTLNCHEPQTAQVIHDAIARFIF